MSNPIPAPFQAIAFIEDALKDKTQDRAVFVHCKCGMGRSASVVICYLVKQVSGDCSVVGGRITH